MEIGFSDSKLRNFIFLNDQSIQPWIMLIDIKSEKD